MGSQEVANRMIEIYYEEKNDSTRSFSFHIFVMLVTVSYPSINLREWPLLEKYGEKFTDKIRIVIYKRGNDVTFVTEDDQVYHMSSASPAHKVPQLCNRNIIMFANGEERMALSEGGDLFMWKWMSGKNKSGFAVWQVHGVTKIRDIAAGIDHYLALNEDGSIYTWGKNEYHQCNQSDDLMVLSPTKYQFSDEHVRMTSVAAGAKFSATLSSDGKIYVWGHITGTKYERVIEVGDGYWKIACSIWNLFALSNNGQLFIMGSDYKRVVSSEKFVDLLAVTGEDHFVVIVNQRGTYRILDMEVIEDRYEEDAAVSMTVSRITSMVEKFKGRRTCTFIIKKKYPEETQLNDIQRKMKINLNIRYNPNHKHLILFKHTKGLCATNVSTIENIEDGEEKRLHFTRIMMLLEYIRSNELENEVISTLELISNSARDKMDTFIMDIIKQTKLVLEPDIAIAAYKKANRLNDEVAKNLCLGYIFENFKRVAATILQTPQIDMRTLRDWTSKWAKTSH